VQTTTAQSPATPPLTPVALTRREHEVLAQLARGRSYQDVARALFVSENTVKTHVTSVYRKLGVYRRIDAISVARQHHLL
jgi:LuxR family maltose regulon positive regulatory protein